MPKIFVSYRRADSAALCGHICERLRQHFGNEEVFRDIESIPPGTDFAAAIAKALSTIAVMVVLIGPNWVGEEKKKGLLRLTRKPKRRIDDEKDLVRLEVEAAIENRILLIPATIDKADLPDAGNLPGKIRKLADYHCLNIDSGIDFDTHIARLIHAIESHINSNKDNAKRESVNRQKSSGHGEPLDGSLETYRIRFGTSADVRETNQIAKLYFEPDLVLPREVVASWQKKNNEIRRVAVRLDEGLNEQELAGYCLFLPLKLEMYELLKNHKIEEKDVTSEDIQQIYSADTEALYILDLSKRPDERVGPILMKDMVRYIFDITKKNPSIKKIGTWVFSEIGQRIVSKVGMDLVREYEDYPGTFFYEMTNFGEELLAAPSSKFIREVTKIPFQEAYTV